jgi:hypothetical protein
MVSHFSNIVGFEWKLLGISCCFGKNCGKELKISIHFLSGGNKWTTKELKVERDRVR